MPSTSLIWRESVIWEASWSMKSEVLSLNPRSVAVVLCAHSQVHIFHFLSCKMDIGHFVNRFDE